MGTQKVWFPEYFYILGMSPIENSSTYLHLETMKQILLKYLGCKWLIEFDSDRKGSTQWEYYRFYHPK